MLILYSKDGLAKKAEIRKFSYNGTFMGECFLSTTIESEIPINFEIGDYCMYRGERFELNYIPAKEKQANAESYGSAFKYENIKLNSLADELTRIEFLDIVLSDNGVHYTSKPDFEFFANGVQELADRIQANLDAEYRDDKKWTIKVLPELVTADKTIKVSGISLWDALALVNSEFKANFIIRNRTITIGTSGYAVGKVFGYGKGNGLYDIQQTTNQDAKIITRLRAYGSTRNMPPKYYNKLVNANGQPYIVESQYIPNLMLPDFPYIENDPKKVYLQSDSFAEYGVKYGSVYFDGSNQDEIEIYPSIEGMTKENLLAAGITVSLASADNGIINEVLGAENPADDGIIPEENSGKSIPKQFVFYLKDLGFDLSEKDADGQYKYATSDTMQISMKSGRCVGRTFDVVEYGIQKDTLLGYTRIKLECNRFKDDSLDMAYPNTNWKIEAGDKFVILGIAMPEVYIKAASQRLLEASKEYLSQNDSTKYTYTPKIDEIFMANHPELGQQIKEGDLFNFTDTDLDIDASVIIQTLTIQEGDGSIPKYELSLSNERITNRIEKIQNAITNLQSNSSSISLEQIKSMLLSVGSNYFLSRTSDDTANGNVTFIQDVSVDKNMLVNKNLQVQGTLIGDVFQNSSFTAGAFGSGFQLKRDSNGSSYAELDYLTVRKEMLVNELSIAKIKSVGGAILLSLASLKTIKVDDKTSYWRCYFNNDNGAITNDFQVKDQAICQTFTGSNIKRYWSLVVGVGADYIDLSKTDKDGTGIPTVGDELIQLGNRTDVNRQAAILLSAYGGNAPAMYQYAQINSFSTQGKEVTAISPNGNTFTGDFKIATNGTTAPIYKDLGLFVNGRTYYLNDRVSHLGSYWVCVVTSTIQTPNETSTAWRKDTAGKTDIDTASNLVRTEYKADFSVLKNEVSSKVSQSDFNALGTRVSTAESAIKQTPDQIKLEVSKIQIGGTNLLLNSSFKQTKGWNRESISSSDSSQVSPFNAACKVMQWSGSGGWYQRLKSYTGGVSERFLAGVAYTISFYGKADSAAVLNVGAEGLSISNFNLTTQWQKFTHTFTGNGAAHTIIFYAWGATANIKYLTQPKLEIGNMPTDWSPAVEDTDAAINLVRSDYTADFSVLKNEVSSKVAQTDFNALGNRVSTAESTIKQTPDQIKLEVSKIQIGGRNLVQASDVYITTGNRNFTFTDYKELRGKTITISVDVEVENATGTRIGFEPAFQYADGTVQYIGTWHYPSSSKNFKGRVSTTATLSDKAITGMTQRGIYVQCTGTLTKVGRPKLEIGNKATDWSAATEDIPEIAASTFSMKNNEISLASQTIKLTGDTIAQAIKAKSLNVNNKAIINTDGSASFGGESTAFNTDGSGKTANGNISWDKNGDLVVTGKFESNSSGNKITINPTARSIEMVSSTNKLLGSWSFGSNFSYLSIWHRPSDTQNTEVTINGNSVALQTNMGTAFMLSSLGLWLNTSMLPTKSHLAALSKGQVYRDGDTLKIKITD